MIYRHYQSKLKKELEPNKAIIIYGPRQVGKTTLVKNFLADYPGKVYESSGENVQLRDLLNSEDFSRIIPSFEDYDLVFIDEAQKIDNIGLGLKIILDQIKGIKVVATGSSSFDLSNKVGEPLVGRQKIFKLYPLAISELVEEFGKGKVLENLENYLIFGTYPETIKIESNNEKISYLNQIRDSYLYKDILELENIKNSQKIYDLLRLLAFQIGHEVSLQKLGTKLGLSKNTVARYLDLLEKAFVLINVRGYSNNLRKEVTKMSRYYFYDNGVRNAVIGNFNFVDSRKDVGQLWENFLFIERIKKQTYTNIYANNFFWRTWDQQEIDLVEERGGNLYGYEFKWNNKLSKVKAPKNWTTTYPDSKFDVINKDNFLDFII